MNGWPGWLPLEDGWVADGLIVIYAAVCIGLLCCYRSSRALRWLQARIPARIKPMAVDDMLHDAWVDIVLCCAGLAVIELVVGAYVAGLGALAIALACGVVLVKP